jgi:hypothetical protein
MALNNLPYLLINYGKVSYVPIFFEKLSKKSFNLDRYMNTFGSIAQETLNSKSGSYRGLIFCVETHYLVFVFTDSVLHNNICKALDEKSGSNLYPKNKYLKIYNDTDRLGASNQPVPDIWCFPFVYFQKDILSTLGDKALFKLFNEKKLQDEFLLNTGHSVIRAFNFTKNLKEK